MGHEGFKGPAGTRFRLRHAAAEDKLTKLLALPACVRRGGQHESSTTNAPAKRIHPRCAQQGSLMSSEVWSYARCSGWTKGA
jgi:hypothetical protein